MNRGLMTSLIAVGAAQLLKIPIHYTKTGQWDLRRAVESGGMPSAHSSGVGALAAYTAARYGCRSAEFAISSMLGIIVMYDAMNIRRHAGETAIQVNDLDEDVERLAGEHPGIYHTRRQKKLKETLGHLPEEVLAGAVLGTATGVISALTAR
ncbi:divergent PAP2 family protein [Paenibacillus tarimensis]